MLRELGSLRSRRKGNHTVSLEEARWFTGLDGVTQVRVLKILDRLKESIFSSAKGESKGIFAARLDFGPGYRVYFGKDGELLVILFAGGSKKRHRADPASRRPGCRPPGGPSCALARPGRSARLPLAAVPEAAQQPIDETAMMLPNVKITELLLEVDAWTGFAGTLRTSRRAKRPRTNPCC